MKVQINKKLKFTLLSLLIILIGTICFLLFNKVSIPIFEEQKTPVYSYNNKGSANYTVFLEPNNLYQGSSLDEGKLYITEFVDYIRTTFNYEFSGERDADLKGTYEIVAKVQGFTDEGEKIKNIWEKNYTIVGQKSFNINGTTKMIKEEVRLDIAPYNTFVTELAESTKINIDTMVTIAMNINLTGTTDKGPIEEIITPSIIIPLDTAMFEIITNNIDKPGAIEETIQVQLPVNTKLVLLYGIIIGILTLGLIFLIFFVKTALDKDPYEKMLQQIFKKHGDRIVALNNDLIITAKYSYVKSIDDLVRIADEVSKPIMYKYSEDYKEIDKFYVTHEDEIYIFNLEELKPIEKVEEIEETRVTSVSEEV